MPRGLLFLGAAWTVEGTQSTERRCVAVESNPELETCSWLHAGYDFGTDTSNYDSVNAKPVADSSRPKPMAMAMAEPTGPPPDMPV